MELKLREEEERRQEESERLDAKMSTSNHNPNTTTPQGSPNKDSVQKGRTRGQGPLPAHLWQSFCLGNAGYWHICRYIVARNLMPIGSRKKRFYMVT
ncbi:hypothetical protein QQF64_026017 [Cirrhinus molitorella]|uniref:Uncharacterized protein n=1 Tax=Cirrhinus molitorella TaxID=172907 RepID=A0ABR3NQP6_9TELE